MGQKILTECDFPQKDHLLETLRNILEITMESFTEHHPSFDVRLWFQLCQKTTNIYNKRTRQENAFTAYILKANDLVLYMVKSQC